MHPPSTTDKQPPARGPSFRRPALRWWPVVTGLAVGAFSIATDDPASVDGALLTLLIPTCAYALTALVGRRVWTWPLTGLVVAVQLAGDAHSGSGTTILVGATVAVVLGGAAAGRWRPPPREMRWQPWGAVVFLAAVTSALLLDVTTAKVVVGVGLLLHGAWDVVHWRRDVVVSRSLAEWCAALDISLGIGILVLVAFA